MAINPYNVTQSAEGTIYEFISEGKRGRIHKVIQFAKITQLQGCDVYNLALTDINPDTGEQDDKVVSDNGDMYKVLETTAYVVEHFLETHPEAVIYAAGSTPSRTRLYQIVLKKNIERIRERYDIVGEKATGYEEFETNNSYLAFLIRRRK